MKKYVRPELFYESFELSQHIAGCSLTTLKVNGAPQAGEPVVCGAVGTIGEITLNGENGSWFLEAPCTVQTEVYCYTNGAMAAATVYS